MYILDEYASYSDEYFNILKPFVSTWNGHLRDISTVKYAIDLESISVLSSYLILYRAKLTARDASQDKDRQHADGQSHRQASTEEASLDIFKFKKMACYASELTTGCWTA